MLVTVEKMSIQKSFLQKKAQSTNTESSRVTRLPYSFLGGYQANEIEWSSQEGAKSSHSINF